MQAVAVLSLQYRMAAGIQLLANTVIYNGQLRCATEAVAQARLSPLPASMAQQLPSWLQQVLALIMCQQA